MAYVFGGGGFNLGNLHVGPPHRSESRALQTSSVSDELMSQALDEFSWQLTTAPSKKRDPIRSAMRKDVGTPANTPQDFTADTSADERLAGYDPSIRRLLVADELLPLLTTTKSKSSFVAKAGGTTIVEIGLDDPAALLKDVDAVRDANDKDKSNRRRTSQRAEVIAQAENAPAFMLAVAGATEATHPYTIECLNLAASVVSSLAHPMKHSFGVLRPVRAHARIVPILQTPSHLSFPSGHATYAYCAAEILASLGMVATDLMATLRRAAALIADNRVVAGVHYPSDGDAGEAVGYALGRWMVGQASADPAASVTPVLATASYTIASHVGTLKYVDAAAHDFTPKTNRWRWMMARAAAEWA